MANINRSAVYQVHDVEWVSVIGVLNMNSIPIYHKVYFVICFFDIVIKFV